MSIEVMTRVFRANLGSCNRKLLALRLADFADDEGKGIWPTVARLALETELSERTVQRLLRDFVDEGLLVVVREASGRPGMATRYDFDLSALGRLKRAKKAQDGCQAVTGDTVTPVTTATETGDNGDRDGCHGDTRTVIEPPIEPSLERDARERDCDDLKKIEKQFKRWFPSWPSYVADSEDAARREWYALNAEQRDACLARTADFVAAVKASGRTKWQAASTYLVQRGWEKLDDPKSDVAPPVAHNAFSRAWHAKRIAELLQPASEQMPPLTGFQRNVIAQGGEAADALIRERRVRYGWPKVNTMHARALQGHGAVVSPELFGLSETFVKAHRDSDEAAAWRALHERMGWPWLPEANGVEWLFFPAGEPGEAIENFRAAISEGRDGYAA